ncbi:MAG: Hsp20/alpha crystallin family protein [Anaerolineae bacterium]|nr:Hsp20/alpha crystallin family protein [Anaerolineae bacterium]
MSNVIRWVPRTPYRTLDQLFNERWTAGNAPSALRPALDVIESEDTITVRVDLPGLSPDDVTIEIDGDLLTISGAFQSEIDEENERYHHRERRYGVFKRTLRLDDTLDQDNTTATFDNGVLTLALPKLPEAQPRRIAVQTA